MRERKFKDSMFAIALWERHATGGYFARDPISGAMLTYKHASSAKHALTNMFSEIPTSQKRVVRLKPAS